jgi:hypothetical protein
VFGRQVDGRPQFPDLIQVSECGAPSSRPLTVGRVVGRDFGFLNEGRKRR